jgi:hypothetical protein
VTGPVPITFAHSTGRIDMTRRTLSALFATMLLFAGCGGSGSNATQPAQASGGGATAAAPTDGGAATQEPTTTDEPAATGGGGVGSEDACRLVTTDEAAAATGMGSVSAGAIPLANLTDAIAGCAYVSGGQIPVLNLIYLDTQVANNKPDDLKLLPGTEEIQVNGARAMWVPGAGQVVFVYKNNKIVMIQVMMPLNNDVKATASSLAQKVADRM